MSKITPSVDSTGEGLATLPYPASTKDHLSQPLLSVAGYAVTIDVLPPSHTLLMQPKKSGLKVLYGSMSGRQALNVPPFTASSTTTEDTSMAADENTGAVILRFNPVGEASTWSETADVPVQTTFDVLEFEPRRFIRVDQLPWGKNPKFEGKDFYNLTGFSFQFEDGKKLAHLQFWTAGKKVNCGVHNHSDCAFEEIHVCLSPGTKNGGMSRLKKDYEDAQQKDLDDLPKEAFDHLVLDRLDQHGGMWERDEAGKAVRRADGIVVYPYHKWQAGDADGIDVWAAIEFSPDLDL